jgi:hypothetical protein
LLFQVHLETDLRVDAREQGVDARGAY